MQYTWLIKLHMSNGQIIEGTYKCGHQNSGDVAKELLAGNDYSYNSILTRDGTGQICFRVRDVSLMTIDPT